MTEEFDPDNPFGELFEIEVTDSLDLHAFSPKEIKAATEVYLEEAHKKGFTIVRVIHGKGLGVQREAVRKVLSASGLVESFKDAPDFSGGRGATVVKMRA